MGFSSPQRESESAKKRKKKEKKGIPCLKRSSSPGKNTDIYHLITTEENIASLNSAQSPHMIKDL